MDIVVTVEYIYTLADLIFMTIALLACRNEHENA